jgi:integrase
MEAYVYVNHSAKCPRKHEGRFYRRCNCRKWIYTAGSRKRISAKTRSWATAEEKKDKLVAPSDQQPIDAEANPTVASDEAVTIDHAIDEYLNDKRSQNLAESTLYKLETIFGKQLRGFCRQHAIVYPRELTVSKLRQFRNSWNDGALARKKKHERIVGFCYFCIANKLGMHENPARQLSRVIVKDKQTLPFSQGEMDIILSSVPKMYADKRGLNGVSAEVLRRRVLAFVLLLRWAGLRIGDAISLERTRLTADGRIMLYMAKTGNPVCVLIPEYVAQLLHSLPNSNPKYFFWTGNGLLKTAVADWQRTLRRLFKLTDLDKRCHPHMFRDTFAVELLLACVPLDQVSMLLGHSSIKITEKHYAPWVKARQQQLEDSVRKAWSTVPVSFIEQPAQVSMRVN